MTNRNSLTALMLGLFCGSVISPPVSAQPASPYTNVASPLTHLTIGYAYSNDYNLSGSWFVNASNRLNAILPANLDLSGTWTLDSVPPPIILPPGYPFQVFSFAPQPPFSIGYAETEHYGFDTMTLSNTGFQNIDPTQGYPAAVRDTNITYSASGFGGAEQGQQTYVTPGYGATRTEVYYYSGTLVHRTALGCTDWVSNYDNYMTSTITYTYYPQTTSFVQDITYTLDAALLLRFDLNNNFLWSDFIFKGVASNQPAYSEIPTAVGAWQQGSGYAAYGSSPDFTANLQTLASTPFTASPYLGVFQSTGGDAITINGAGYYTNAGASVLYHQTSADFIVPVPELGTGCVYSPGSMNSPALKWYDFGAVCNAGGTVYWDTNNGVTVYQASAPTETSVVLWRRRSGPTTSLPSGAINGQLVDTNTHLAIARGRVYLFAQNKTLNPPTAGLAPSNYFFYVTTNSTYYAVTTVDPNGNFSFANVPLYQPGGTTSTGLRAVEYAAFASGAEANGFDTNNPVIFYQDNVVANLVPQTPAVNTKIPLVSLSDFGVKKSLANTIIEQSLYAGNYPSEESTVVGDINTYLQNTAAVTPAQEEGVKRAIWGERGINEGALDAKQMFPPMVKALATVINNALSAALPNTTGRGPQGKAYLDTLAKGPPSVADLAKFKVNPANPGAIAADLIKDGYNMEGLDLVDNMLDGVGLAISGALATAGMSDGKAANISSGFIKGMKIMTKVIRSASGLGTSANLLPGTTAGLGSGGQVANGVVNSLGSTVISFVVPLFADPLYDSGVFPFSSVSYCTLTLPQVRDCRLLMEQWTNVNPGVYLGDAQNANAQITNLVLLVQNVNEALAWINAITDTASTSSSVLGLIGKIPGAQWFGAAGKAAGGVEKVGNALQLATPAVVIYYNLPNAVSNVVYTAFGNPPPPAQSQIEYPPVARKAYPRDSFTAASLTNGLAQAYSAFNGKVTTIIGSLQSNDIGNVITQMVVGLPTFGQSAQAWNRAAARVRQSAATATSAGFPPDTLTGLAALESGFSIRAGAYQYELVDLIRNIYAATYTNVTDSNYIAAKASAIADGQAVLASLQSQYSQVASLATSFNLSGNMPIVEVTLTAPVSQSTGYPWASSSNEMFTLSAAITNVSPFAVSNVTLNLEIQGGSNVAACLSPTNMPSAPLTLAGGAGTTLSWNIQYTGALDSQSAYFVVNVEENGTNAVDFSAGTETQTLQADPSLVDSDGDGIPNDWMMLFFGHPNGEASDHSLATDPAPNGDGYTILQNYEMGLDPTGSNFLAPGSVVPTVTDLVLSTQSIELGPNSNSATITVNAGGGATAYWTASVDAGLPVTLSPGGNFTGTNGQSITVVLAPNYNFTNAPRIQSTVQIIPAGLSSGPAKQVALTIDGAAGTPQTGKPIIVLAPKGGSVMTGSTVTLTALAGGSGPLQYQWEFNNKKITGATNASLVLNNTDAKQTGHYTLLIENTLGKAETSTELTVFAPLTITEQPSAPAPKVAATGPGPLHYQWYANGAPLKGKTSPALLSGPAGLPAAGTYQVVVSNRYETLSSTSLVAGGLTLSANGLGKIRPGFAGTNLFLNASYSITALPQAHWAFSNWTGGTNKPYTNLGNSPKLVFTMQPGLVIQANFTAPAAEETAGVYHGLFAPTNVPRANTNSGAVELALAPTGRFTGKLHLGAETVTLSGTFNSTGMAQAQSPRKNLPALDTTLQLDATNRAITGSVTDGSFVAMLSADLDVFAGQSGTPYTGEYVITVPGSTNATAGPGGTSVGTLKIDSMGNISFAGSLADGAAVTQSSVVSKDGLWPFYAALDNGGETLWAWNQFSNGTITPASGLSWIDAAHSGGKERYPSGFTNQSAALSGVPYNPEARPLAGFTTGLVILSGGDLSAPLTNHVTLSAEGAVKVTDSKSDNHSLELRVNPQTGAITGSFADPADANKPAPISGVLDQSATNGTGYFLGTTSGQFQLIPAQ